MYFYLFSGLDPQKDEELLWVAKEGILAKLQPPWKAINQEGVGLYYFNFETGQSMWEHPNDEYYRHKVKQEREKKKPGKKPKSSKVTKLSSKICYNNCMHDRLSTRSSEIDSKLRTFACFICHLSIKLFTALSYTV